MDLRAASLPGASPPTASSLRTAALAGNDLVIGSGHTDRVFAAAGNDRINGRGGNDSLNGMEGNDVLTGGQGVDNFNFTFVGPFGRDRVTDFDVEHETMALPNDDFILIKDGPDTILAFEDGSRIRLDDIRPTDITTDNYVVVG